MSSLAHTLFRSSPERLREIAALWGLEAIPGFTGLSAASLLGELCSLWHVRRVYQQLPPESRFILDLLSSRQYSWLTIERIGSLSKLDRQSLGAILGQISRMAIIDVRKVKFREPRSTKEAPKTKPLPGPTSEWIAELHAEIRSALRLMKRQGSVAGNHARDLRQYFRGLDVTSLQMMAREWGIDKASALDRNGLAELLPVLMKNRRHVDEILGGCSQQAQLVFHLLAEQGGSVDLEEFMTWTIEPVLREQIEELELLALLFVVRSEDSWVLKIPEEVLAAVRGPEKGDNLSQVEVPELIVGSSAHICLAMLAIISFIERHTLGLAITNDGKLTGSAVRGLREATRIDRLQKYENQYFDFLFHTALGLGIIKRQGEVLVLGDSIGEWSELSFEEQSFRIADQWRTDILWNGPDVKGRRDWTFDLRAIRSLLVTYLGQWCLDDGWYSCEAFTSRLVDINPRILQGVNKSYSSKRQRQELSDESGRRAALQSAITSIISLPMVWVGLVEVGDFDGGLALAFKVTGFGKSFLTGKKTDLHRSSEEFRVSVRGVAETFNLQACGQAAYQLRHFADLVKIECRGEFEISQESIQRGLSLGLTRASIVDILTNDCGVPLHSSALSAIERWANAHRSFRLANCTLLEVESEQVLDDILSIKSLATVVWRRVGPKAVLLRENLDFDGFLACLQRHGFSLSTSRFDNEKGLK